MAHNMSGEGAGARVFAVEADPAGDPDGQYRNGGRPSRAGGVPAKPVGVWQKLAAAAGKLIRPTPGAGGGLVWLSGDNDSVLSLTLWTLARQQMVLCFYWPGVLLAAHTQQPAPPAVPSVRRRVLTAVSAVAPFAALQSLPST
jgi:hypothetical protein